MSWYGFPGIRRHDTDPSWDLIAVVRELILFVPKILFCCGKSLHYQLQRKLRHPLAQRPLPKTSGNRFLRESAALQQQAQEMVVDLERQLAWRKWPRCTLGEFAEDIDDFLASTMVEAEYQLELGSLRSTLHNLSCSAKSARRSDEHLELLREQTLLALTELDRLHCVDLGALEHPYRHPPLG